MTHSMGMVRFVVVVVVVTLLWHPFRSFHSAVAFTTVTHHQHHHHHKNGHRCWFTTISSLCIRNGQPQRNYNCWSPPRRRRTFVTFKPPPPHKEHPIRASTSSLMLSSTQNENTESSSSSSSSSSWNGEVTSNTKDGRIRGCVIQPARDGVPIENNSDALDRILSKNTDSDTMASNTEWMIQIDGVEADLGRFSLAIYKKFLQDAKQQQFQGYRRGTIPPPLLSTYKAYTMDECARETILEALEQNQIRPFDTCRNEMILYDFSLPPASTSSSSTKKSSKSKSKNSKGKKKSSNSDTAISNDTSMASSTTSTDETTNVASTITTTTTTTTLNENDDTAVSPAITTTTTLYATMKEAIDVGGWQPGQSFSFCAKQIRGQSQRLSMSTTRLDRPQPLGVDY